MIRPRIRETIGALGRAVKSAGPRVRRGGPHPAGRRQLEDPARRGDGPRGDRPADRRRRAPEAHDGARGGVRRRRASPGRGRAGPDRRRCGRGRRGGGRDRGGHRRRRGGRCRPATAAAGMPVVADGGAEPPAAPTEPVVSPGRRGRATGRSAHRRTHRRVRTRAPPPADRRCRRRRRRPPARRTSPSAPPGCCRAAAPHRRRRSPWPSRHSALAAPSPRRRSRSPSPTASPTRRTDPHAGPDADPDAGRRQAQITRHHDQQRPLRRGLRGLRLPAGAARAARALLLRHRPAGRRRRARQGTVDLYARPVPFTGWRVTDRPSGATQMCILVANADHSVVQGTGNCVDLPAGRRATCRPSRRSRDGGSPHRRSAAGVARGTDQEAAVGGGRRRLDEPLRVASPAG